MMNPSFAKVADFSHAEAGDTLDLSGADFHGAILRDSNFIGVDLHGASFDSADLIHVNCAGANLAGAQFTDYGHTEYFVNSMTVAGYSYPPALPDFTCADLSNADFTGSVFFGIYSGPPNVLNAAYPILQRANLSNANLGRMWVFTAKPSPGNYSPTQSEQISAFLFTGAAQVGTIRALRDASGKQVSVNILWGLPTLRIKEPVSPEYWLSVRQVFSNLASARNLQSLAEYCLYQPRPFLFKKGATERFGRQLYYAFLNR